ncbi:hypothetical protein NX059_002711 [Plenodomus lindquistii]|nr:hypothetical protein NX059_002711 [Plenodomus lindquistii]
MSRRPRTAKTPKAPTFPKTLPTPPATSPVRNAENTGAAAAAAPPPAVANVKGETKSSHELWQKLSLVGPPVAWWPTQVASVSCEKKRSIIASLSTSEPFVEVPYPSPVRGATSSPPAHDAPSSSIRHLLSPSALMSPTPMPNLSSLPTSHPSDTPPTYPHSEYFSKTAHLSPGAVFHDIREQGKATLLQPTVLSQSTIDDEPPKPVLQTLEPWQRGIVRMVGGHAPESEVGDTEMGREGGTGESLDTNEKGKRGSEGATGPRRSGRVTKMRHGTVSSPKLEGRGAGGVKGLGRETMEGKKKVDS